MLNVYITRLTRKTKAKIYNIILDAIKVPIVAIFLIMITHEFVKELHKRYKKEGIEIPFPIHTVYMRKKRAYPPRLFNPA